MRVSPSLKIVGLLFLCVLTGGVVLGTRNSRAVEASDTLFAAASTNDPLHPRVQFVASPTANTLIDAFKIADTPYYPEDRVTAFPDPSLGLGSVVTVDRALPVELVDGKRVYTLRTWQKTVGEMLTEKGVELGAEDKIAPAPATNLSSGMKVVITRVARTTVTETEVIPFQKKERENSNMWRGEKKLAQVGKNGKREKQYLVVREDGELVSKTLTSNKFVEAVVDQITEIGTKLKIGETYRGKATYYENNYGTKVATDKFKRGVTLRVSNLNNGRSIIVVNDGCICGNDSVLIDLNPDYFRQLGGTLGQGVLQNVLIEEILNP